MSRIHSAPSTCLVCASPTATSLHFGARACKACAAFFRRTISMSMKYACTSENADLPCKINYQLRMICRCCRFTKCVESGMRRDMVQRRDGSRSPLPRSKKIKRRLSSEELDTDMTMKFGADTPTDPPSARNLADFSPIDQPTPCCSSVDLDIRVPSMFDIDAVIAHYRTSEMALFDRRRMLYGDCGLFDIFEEREDTPFRRNHLRPFTLEKFKGMTKSDLICIVEHTRDLMLFPKMRSRSDKSLVLRYVLSIDYVLGSAYMSEKLGREERLLVLTDATYINMCPLPMSGYEEKAETKFATKKEWETHKLFMPMYIQHWIEVIEPFFDMNLSFNEYVLLKALVCFQMVHFRLSSDGRSLCEQQRNLLIAALHKVAEDDGVYDPAVRVGNIILLMSTIMNYTSSLISHYFKIKLFNLAEIDPLIMEMCSFQF